MNKIWFYIFLMAFDLGMITFSMSMYDCDNFKDHQKTFQLCSESRNTLGLIMGIVIGIFGLIFIEYHFFKDEQQKVKTDG